MCTLSLVRFADIADGRPFDCAQGKPSWRVMFNRDEQCTRPAARPPVACRMNSVRAVHPIDVPSGGTWIAATSMRFVFALLNEYAPGAVPGAVAPDSRGRIIPVLLDARDATAIETRVRRLPLARFAPFRLVAMDDRAVRELVSDGQTLHVTSPVQTDCWMRTSSSVCLTEIQAIRTAAFDRVVAVPSHSAQECFHAYICPDRPEAGVRMTRADARTVSVTTVDVFADRLQMTYRPLVADTKAAP